MTSNESNPIQSLYNLWCFICLYTLGAIYIFIELNRRYQLFSHVRRLNLDVDLNVDLKSRVAVITGASRGIGWYTAKFLMRKGCHVIITTSVLPGEQMEALRSKLSAELGEVDGKFELWNLELTSMESVLKFIKRFKESELDLNLLINNAGCMYVPFKMTEDDFESHMAVNYLSHCLLIWGLLPRLNETGRKIGQISRIVNVASSTHYSRDLNLDDLHGLKMYSPYHAYAQSKLAQIMFTFKLNEYLNDKLTGGNFGWVTVNSLHPGVAMTALYEHVWWVKKFPSLPEFFFRSAEDGSETVLYTALSPELDGVGGKYLEDCAIVKSSKFSRRTDMQERLWQQTWKMLEPWVTSAKIEMPIGV